MTMVKTILPGDDFPGIDPTYSPAMRDLVIKSGANRHARGQCQKARKAANSELAALVALPEVGSCPDARAAGQALLDAPEDRRREPAAIFTDALVDLARQYPPGNSTRARLFALIEQVARLLGKAQEARRQEVVILERLNTLAREIEAQYALERKQGGGVH